jgi:TetR/AcrR family transcriptional regulator
MDDVALASGVGKGTLYRYFPGKSELYTALLFAGIDELRSDLSDALRAPGEPIEKLERVVRRCLEHMWPRRFVLALLHRREHTQSRADAREWQRRRAKLSRVIESAIEAAIAAGQVRPIDAALCSEMLLGMLRAADRHRGPADGIDELTQAVFELFVGGAATAEGRRAWSAARRRRAR